MVRYPSGIWGAVNASVNALVNRIVTGTRLRFCVLIPQTVRNSCTLKLVFYLSELLLGQIVTILVVQLYKYTISMIFRFSKFSHTSFTIASRSSASVFCKINLDLIIFNNILYILILNRHLKMYLWRLYFSLQFLNVNSTIAFLLFYILHFFLFFMLYF